MVVKKCDPRNLFIMNVVKKIVQEPPENLINQIKCCVTCGGKNQQFTPNEDTLNGLISDAARLAKVMQAGPSLER